MNIFHCMIIYISYNDHSRFIYGSYKGHIWFTQGSYMVHTRSALCHCMVKIILSFIDFEN